MSVPDARPLLYEAARNRSDRSPAHTMRQQRLEEGDFGLADFVATLRHAPRAIEAFLDGGVVGQPQLGLDDFYITHRIDTPVHMHDVVVLETADHVCNRIRLANVGQILR